MLNELILDLGKGNIGAKVRHYPLQRPRTAAVTYFRSIRKRANMLAPLPVLHLFYVRLLFLSITNMPLNHSQERWHVRRHRYLH